MPKKLLIIKTGNTITPLLQEGVDFEDWFIAGLGLAKEGCLVNSLFEGDALPELGQLRGIIVTGSPAYVTDGEEWNYLGADYLRSAHDLGIPILGVCYGHQLLAWAFGGDVDFHAKGREIGTVDIELSAAGCQDRLLSNLPQRFKVQVSHQQTVTRLPANAVLLAANGFDPHHGFRLGNSTWGLQFHPEFSAAVMRAYIRERSPVIIDEGSDPAELSGQVEDTPESASLLRRFATLCEID